jgi:hypothetical protein
MAVFSSRRGSCLPGQGAECKARGPALRPLGLAAVSACREEINRPDVASEVVPGPGGARDTPGRSPASVAGVLLFYASGGCRLMRGVSLFAGVGGVDGELMLLAVGVRLGVPVPHAPS